MGYDLGSVLLLFCLPAFALSGDHPIEWDREHLHQLSYNKTFAQLDDKSADKAKLKQAIIEALAGWLDLSLEVPRKLTLEEVISSSLVELAELEPGRAPDVFVQASAMQGGCGAAGNCPLWIFRRSASGYELLLESQGERIKILPVEAGHNADVVVSFRHGFSGQILRVYSFSSGKYRQRACYDRLNHIDGKAAVVDCK